MNHSVVIMNVTMDMCVDRYRGVKKIEVISPEGLSQEFEELKNHGALHSESENAWDNYFDKWYSGHLSQDV